MHPGRQIEKAADDLGPILVPTGFQIGFVAAFRFTDPLEVHGQEPVGEITVQAT